MSMADASLAPGLTPERFEELMTLLQGADSVELKLTVPDGDQRSAVQALQMDPLEAEVRQVFFFDTPDLTLNQQGVIVRARRTPGGDDSVVKLRPVVPSEVPAHLRALKGFGVEVDAMPGGFVCSGRLKSKLRAGKVKEAMLGKRSILGPITVMKLKFSPDGYDGRMVAELWFYPDGSRILELSTKAATSDA